MKVKHATKVTISKTDFWVQGLEWELESRCCWPSSLFILKSIHLEAFSICLKLPECEHMSVFLHICSMEQQLTEMVGLENVTSCSNTHHVMATFILCYALKAGESQSGSFQRNKSCRGLIWCETYALTQSYIYCILRAAKEEQQEPVWAVRRWTLNNVSGRACGGENR